MLSSDTAALATRLNVVPPTPPMLKARMRELQPAFRARAQATEQARRVSDESLDLLREAGLFGIAKPRMFGGYEHDFDVVVELIMEAAMACPATGWVYALHEVHNWLLAKFEPALQHEIWDGGGHVAICGSYAPAGKAVAVEGGFELSGQWAFASGCDSSDWAICASILPSAEHGPLPAFLAVPASDYTILDSWHVAGLAGTGSKTLVIEKAFVPTHRSLPFRLLMGPQAPGLRIHENPSFAMPMLCNLPSTLAAVAVGGAQGALDHYLDTIGSRLTRGTTAGGNARMAEFPTVQMRVAEAAASLDAAREILLRDLRARAESAKCREPITMQDRITSRRGQAFAVSLAVRAVEALNASTGGAGLDLANPVQRAWRDVNAVGRHISLNWDAVATMYGQMALGLEPKGQY